MPPKAHHSSDLARLPESYWRSLGTGTARVFELQGNWSEDSEFLRLMPIPESFICPLSMAPMQNPVATSDGQLYERALIEQWFRQCLRERRPLTSPLTGLALPNERLFPVFALQKAIEVYLQNRPELRDVYFTSRSFEEASRLLQEKVLEKQKSHDVLVTEIDELRKKLVDAEETCDQFARELEHFQAQSRSQGRVADSKPGQVSALGVQEDQSEANDTQEQGDVMRPMRRWTLALVYVLIMFIAVAFFAKLCPHGLVSNVAPMDTESKTTLPINEGQDQPNTSADANLSSDGHSAVPSGDQNYTLTPAINGSATLPINEVQVELNTSAGANLSGDGHSAVQSSDQNYTLKPAVNGSATLPINEGQDQPNTSADANPSSDGHSAVPSSDYNYTLKPAINGSAARSSAHKHVNANRKTAMQKIQELTGSVDPAVHASYFDALYQVEVARASDLYAAYDIEAEDLNSLDEEVHLRAVMRLWILLPITPDDQIKPTIEPLVRIITHNGLAAGIAARFLNELGGRDIRAAYVSNIVKAGAVMPLLNLAREGSGQTEETRCDALRTLISFTGHANRRHAKKARLAITRAGGISLLMKNFQVAPSEINGRVMRETCKLLGHLAQTSPENKDSILLGSGSDALMKLLLESETNDFCRELFDILFPW